MEDDVYGSMERVFGTVSKRIRLPHDTDYKRIKAIYEDGVLRITIPKPYTEKTVAQEIEIPVLCNCLLTDRSLIRSYRHCL